jgi:hypothetical protein
MTMIVPAMIQLLLRRRPLKWRRSNPPKIQTGVRDPVEQLDDLKTRIDALMKGCPGQI